jgi:excisionase family DNA binding protein
MNSREGRGAHVGPLLTVAEVADVLRVSNMTVYRLIKAGDISALRVGKNYRIRQQVLEDYLADGSVAADEANG